MRFSAFTLIPSAFLALIFMMASGCTRMMGVPDVGVLKTQYPVIHYLPLKERKAVGQSFTVSMSKARPAGWTSLGEISKSAVGAIIVSEDWAFYQHKGYDPNQIREAIKDGVEEGRMRGASTITQQVARNVFLSQQKSVLRKVRELGAAVKLEEQVGKRRILETYLNIAEWGEGVFGIRAAARQYFNKSPSELNAKEGAFLAMLLPSPKRYSQSFRARKLTRYANNTVQDILDKMVQAHYLTPEQKTAEWVQPLSFEVVTNPETVESESEI